MTTPDPRIGEIVRVTPVAGRTVRNPASGQILAGNRRVSWSGYWAARRRDGDIELAAAEAKDNDGDGDTDNKPKRKGAAAKSDSGSK